MLVSEGFDSCFNETVIDGKDQACQKEIMDAEMPQLIKLRYITEEIESGVFKIHDSSNQS